jgi:acetylornithine deacetylase/succinyl-diaminopimelate desuccinylase-like protein
MSHLAHHAPRVMLTALAALGLRALPATAQDLPARLRGWVATQEATIVADAASLLTLPNVASDSVAIRRNAAELITRLRQRGVTARLLESPSGGPPAVYGELLTPGATRTVVLYAHYDGQPVATGPWAGDPWQPVLRYLRDGVPTDPIAFPAPGTRVDPELRLYARSASDDKGPIVAMLAALDALRALGQRPSVNVKFFFEGEEEAGSPNLGALLTAHRETLAADAWIFADGPVHVSGAPQLVLGVRGAFGLTLTLYGPSRALHSGHYGNWAPNPAQRLTHVLASMRDTDGRITIAGFHDDVLPPTPAERAAAAQLAATDDSVRRSLRLGTVEGGGAPLAERILAPALNVRGLRAGAVGPGATNAIPTSASASIDFRLVPRQTPDGITRQVTAHLTALGYEVTTDPQAAATHPARERLVLLEWTGGYRAQRIAFDHPLVGAVRAVSAAAYGRAPLVAPILGGSLPMYLFEDILGAPLLVLPTVNADNNQHAPDEHLRVGNLFDAVVLFGTLFSDLDGAWTRALRVQ